MSLDKMSHDTLIKPYDGPSKLYDGPSKLYDKPSPTTPAPNPVPVPIFQKRPPTAKELARNRRREQALNQKLLLRLVAERFNAPDGRFARGLMRIVNRNLDSRFTRLGLK